MIKQNRFFVLIFMFFVSVSTLADDAVKCRYVLSGSLPIQYHGAGMQLVTEGQIEHTPAVFLLDTGAATTVLTRFGTDKRGLKKIPTVHAYSGVGGYARTFKVPLNHIQVGPIKSEQMGGMTEIDEFGRRPNYDALLGSDFLLTMDMEISLSEKRLKFFTPHNCSDTFLGYWNPGAVVVPLQFEPDFRRPMIDVVLNGVKMTALIDSGATVSVVSLAAAQRAGVTVGAMDDQKSSASGIGDKVVATQKATLHTFSVGDETIQNAALQIIDIKGRGMPDVVLGDDFLRSHRILFAVSQKLVYLSYIGGPAFSKGNAQLWIEPEANAGNGYAQYDMALTGLKSTDATVHGAAQGWMDKAVVNRIPPALHYMASQYESEKRYDEAIAALAQVLELDSYDLDAQLEMYTTRIAAGMPEQASAGLKQALAQFKWPPWPAPVTQYYLGTTTLNELLHEAASDSDLASRRRCDVYKYAGQLQAALGHPETTQELKTKADVECRIELH